MIIGKNIDLRPLTLDDAEFILSLRLNPELSKFLNPVEDNLDKQREWIQNCINDSQQWYFIIQNKKGDSVGTIRIYNVQGNRFCWGSWIVKPEARLYASFESAVLIYQYAFFTLGFDYTVVDVRKKNENVIRFHTKFGATLIDENDQDVFLTYAKETFIARKLEYQAVIDKIATRKLTQ